MISCQHLIFSTYTLQVKLISNLKKIFLQFIPFIFIFSFLFLLLKTYPVEASTINDDKLIQKISKDYTNKFCNSIAFGLSKDSAMRFANKENNLIFKSKKGFESINKNLIANSISVSVVENCGYLINLKGEEGANQFENDYILMNNQIQK